jgi:hypothetical protein
MQAIRMSRVLPTLAAALGLLAGAAGFAEDSTPGMTAVIPGDTKLIDIKWQKAGKTVPYGMRVLMLYGDPTKPGPYVYRVRVPTAYRLAPHKFPDDHVVTVLKGIWWHGDGERYDPFKMDEYFPGTTYVTRAGAPHFDFARTEVVLEVMGNGPVDNPITYLNPDDDPRNN